MKKIVLLGYMGCGKSTIANNLSQKTAISYLDLDHFIEEKTNLSIKALFEKHGEVYFRKVEHQAFVEVLAMPGDRILGLGGGTPCYANNHVLLQQPDVISIYLKASIDTLFERLSKNRSKRPVIANLNEEELKEFIAKHLFDRSFYYHQAQHILPIDGKSVAEIVASIELLLA
ncbi:shikimate kinase [Flavobacterium succinicans]|uniref:Shikimate kinase n=1 Tax=Flavobacterium succinicans TaxID=29536 RepID=A0A1I4SMT0_9FLAO|nr:shikimate kinase [Flavobacterium succinicans]SFM65764.1 shikimate kinase [Flavobacterium succinicans]